MAGRRGILPSGYPNGLATSNGRTVGRRLTGAAWYNPQRQRMMRLLKAHKPPLNR